MTRFGARISKLLPELALLSPIYPPLSMIFWDFLAKMAWHIKTHIWEGFLKSPKKWCFQKSRVFEVKRISF